MRGLNKIAVVALAASAALAIAVPAHATTVTALSAGVLTSPYAGGVADFDSPLSITPSGATAPPQGPFSFGTASFDGSGILMTGTVEGLYATPFHDATQYLTVRPNGDTETVSFSGGLYTQLGLYWGSMDTYNSIEFYNGATLLATVTGTQAAFAVSAAAVGAQTDDSNNRFIQITGIGDGSGFDSIVLISTTNSFELDNLTWGGLTNAETTPLPGALSLFASGLGAMGLIGWRRKKRKQSTLSAIA